MPVWEQNPGIFVLFLTQEVVLVDFIKGETCVSPFPSRMRRYKSMKSLFLGYGSKKFLLVSLAIASLSGLSYFYTQTSNQVQNLSVLSDGARTCFGRVQQSFMARMLGDTKSQYLTSEFMGNTEKCLGEVSSLVATHFASQMAEAEKKINTLATDVHWFHERISPDSEAFTKSAAGVLISNIGGRYAKLEMSHNFILDELQNKHEELGESLTLFSWALQICAGLSLLLLALEIFERRLQGREFQKLEAEAKRLSDSQDMTALRVQEVLKKALKHKGMEQCQRLFSQFHLYKTKVGSEAVYIPYGQIQAPQAIPGQSNEDVLDEIWERSEHDDSHLVVYDEMFQRETKEILGRHESLPEDLIPLSVEEMTGRMIDHLSGQIFTKGIQVEMNISEDHAVYARPEELEQILCQALGLMLKENSKSLKVESKKLGQVVIVDVESVGSGFSDGLVKSQLLSERTSVDVPLELMICQELCSDVSAKMSYDNVYSNEGDVIGKSIRLTFKAATLEQEASSKKVVSIEKGTKRELMQRLQSGS